MRRPVFLQWLSAILLALLAHPTLAQDRMELHLVLAFDVSASVNDAEYDLQRHGTAWALRSDAIALAIETAPGGIAVAVVQWSSLSQQALGLDWVRLQTRADVPAYADMVEALPRRISGGGTMYHSGLDFSGQMLETAPYTARRHVIDIIANGRTDDQDQLRASRDQLLRKGVVINGLAIEEHRDDLTSYFYRFVIGGPGAFVVTAQDFKDFGDAMQIKLYREITDTAVSDLPAFSSKISVAQR